MDSFSPTALRHHLSTQDISQGELARRCYFCKTTVSRWVNGSRKPFPQHAELVAKTLGITVDDLKEAR